MSIRATASAAQTLHRARHEVSNRQNVAGGNLRTRPQLDHDARLGWLLLVKEDRFLRQAQMHARFDHLRHAHDGAFQLPFERTLIVDVFYQLGSSESSLCRTARIRCGRTWAGRRPLQSKTRFCQPRRKEPSPCRRRR